MLAFTAFTAVLYTYWRGNTAAPHNPEVIEMFKLSVKDEPSIELGEYATLEECKRILGEGEKLVVLYEQGKINLEDHPILKAWEGSDIIATNTETGETYIENWYWGWVKQ
jgi:hypothetical protein